MHPGKYVRIGGIRIKKHLLLTFILVGVACLVYAHHAKAEDAKGVGDVLIVPAAERILARAEKEAETVAKDAEKEL